MTVVLVNSFREGTGWRGYAQPLLQTPGTDPFVATLAVARIWALWQAGGSGC